MGGFIAFLEAGVPYSSSFFLLSRAFMNLNPDSSPAVPRCKEVNKMFRHVPKRRDGDGVLADIKDINASRSLELVVWAAKHGSLALIVMIFCSLPIVLMVKRYSMALAQQGFHFSVGFCLMIVFIGLCMALGGLTVRGCWKIAVEGFQPMRSWGGRELNAQAWARVNEALSVHPEWLPTVQSWLAITGTLRLREARILMRAYDAVEAPARAARAREAAQSWQVAEKQRRLIEEQTEQRAAKEAQQEGPLASHQASLRLNEALPPAAPARMRPRL